MANLSVFFPAYNEVDNIVLTVTKAVEILKKLNLDWEIIIVDDGSTDGTAKKADELSQKINGVRVIHQTNGGYGKALRTGFENCRNLQIVYTDADGQFDFSEVSKFLEAAKEADLVIGFRIKRQDPLFRLLFAKGWALALRIFFGLNLKDVDCGFKLIKKEALEKILPLESTRGGMINAELAIKAQKRGFKIAQVGVNHHPRIAGSPTGARVGVIVKSFWDLLKLWWKLR